MVLGDAANPLGLAVLRWLVAEKFVESFCFSLLSPALAGADPHFILGMRCLQLSSNSA